MQSTNPAAGISSHVENEAPDAGHLLPKHGIHVVGKINSDLPREEAYLDCPQRFRRNISCHAGGLRIGVVPVFGLLSCQLQMRLFPVSISRDDDGNSFAHREERRLRRSDIGILGGYQGVAWSNPSALGYSSRQDILEDPARPIRICLNSAKARIDSVARSDLGGGAEYARSAGIEVMQHIHNGGLEGPRGLRPENGILVFGNDLLPIL